MKKIINSIYFVTLIVFFIYSWGFVDANIPIKIFPFLNKFIWSERALATFIYIALVFLLFICFGYQLWLVSLKRVDFRYIRKLIIASSLVLFFSYPGFTYDIYNYIATAKVAFIYHENPYIVMPIEISNEPMLNFMHASNKVALYGFSWVALTVIPLFLGLGNIFILVFAFKGLVIFFYGLLLWLLWKLSGKNLWTLTFFALNPLVMIETLISGHNDVVMLTMALMAYYFFKKNRLLVAWLFLFCSIFVKFATLALVPIFLYLTISHIKGRTLYWSSIWKWSAISLYIVFLLAPFREEIYSWYLIWPLTFVALAYQSKLLVWLTLGFSFGLPLRFAPFIYYRDWGGYTPYIKKLTTFIFPVLTSLYYVIKKKV